MRRREFIILLGGAALGGPAATWPRAVDAQPSSPHRIAIVRPTSVSGPTGTNPYWRAFLGELARLGHSEGKNLAVDWYSAEGRADRLPELARNVVDSRPDVIFVISGTLVRHFKDATDAIPIVGITSDPIAAGSVPSLARPAGNFTGVATDAGLEIWEKRLALLKELVPSASRIGFLAPTAAADSSQGRALRDAMLRADVAMIVAALESPIDRSQYLRVFERLARERAHAVIVNDSPENFGHQKSIVELAAMNKLPAIYCFRDFAEAGGLMSYAVDLLELFNHAAGQIAKILRGTKVGEIPVYQATTFKLAVNLKTAKALGLTIPAALLARADEVIE